MYSLRNLISDVWSYVSAYKKDFWLATSSRVVADLVWLYPPYALAIIVNFFVNYEPGKPLEPLYTIFILMIAVTAVRYVALYYAKSTIFRVSEKSTLDAQFRSMKHLMLLDMAWHEKESAGSKFKRIERGASSIDRILRIWINDIIEIVINLVGVTLIIIKFDFVIGAAVLIFIVSYYFLAYFYRKRAVHAADVVNSKEEKRSGMLFESINNIRSVKVMSMAEKILDTLSINAADIFVAIQKRIYWFQSGNAIRNFYAHIFRIGAMVFIVYGVLEGRYEIGFLVLFTGYFATIWQSMSSLTDVSEDFAIAKNALSRMQTILDTPIMIDREDGKIKFPNSWKTISIKNVSFSYQNKPVLDDVSFEVKRGEKIGIVGLSGAGKSTLFKLLLKEYESYSGEIIFDDIVLKNISKKDYFNHLAVVLQDTELFNTSLRENITMTNQKEEKNDVLLENSIEIAHVKDFMQKLPDGMASVIGEKGIKLSGGEKQRVGIARAIFKNPQILLLDEATSHLDIESEEKIQDSLHKFFQSVTAIVIAHRLTTIKEMDKIIVIENGKVVESGNFADLYSAKGRFFELWEKQKL
jgi:ATP-binding cassette subfamily B protein